MSHIYNELLLEIFPYLALTSLIAVRGVCKLWKTLIELADIPPARRQLLELYECLLLSPAFIPTRPWTLEHLEPFDRQAYIDALLDQHNAIPEDFRLWILEWPSRAVINCIWPGLPCEFYNGRDLDRNIGANFLATIPPVVHTVQFDVAHQKKWYPLIGPDDDGDEDDDDDDSPEDWRDAPALLIHGTVGKDTWLILEPHHPGPLSFSIFQESGDRYMGEVDPDRERFSSWISFLQTQLLHIEQRVSSYDPNDPTLFRKVSQAEQNFLPWKDSHQTGRKPGAVCQAANMEGD